MSSARVIPLNTKANLSQVKPNIRVFLEAVLINSISLSNHLCKQKEAAPKNRPLMMDEL